MKAVVYKGNGQIAMEERPMPVIVDETDAIVEVTLTTICSSDIHIKHGAVPRAVPGTVLGHEFVGRVVETGMRTADGRWGAGLTEVRRSMPEFRLQIMALR